MLTLYYTPGTCALAVRIALEEAAAPHQLVRVDFAAGQLRTPAYLATDPRSGVRRVEAECLCRWWPHH